MSHILLVEDEPLQRELMAESLSAAGYDVTATCTGDEAAILLADRDSDEFQSLPKVAHVAIKEAEGKVVKDIATNQIKYRYTL